MAVRDRWVAPAWLWSRFHPTFVAWCAAVKHAGSAHSSLAAPGSEARGFLQHQQASGEQHCLVQLS